MKTNDVIAAARYYLGYLEKASGRYVERNDRDVFPLDPGAANQTYFGYLCGCEGQPWCAAFVSTVLYDAAGRSTGTARAAMFGLWPYLACNQLYDAAPVGSKGRRGAWTPAAGDVVIFTDDGSTRTHTGIVESVDDTYIYTIEGNSKNQVRRRSYKRTDGYIWGYVRLNVERSTTDPDTERYGEYCDARVPLLSKGTAGEAVRVLQLLLGFTGDDLDGIFGPKTDEALRRYQRGAGLYPDGICGPKTWAMLLGQ